MIENKGFYLAEFQMVFGYPHHDDSDEDLTPIKFALQVTDYKSVKAYRKFTDNNAWSPNMFYVAGNFGGLGLQPQRELDSLLYPWKARKESQEYPLVKRRDYNPSSECEPRRTSCNRVTSGLR